MGLTKAQRYNRMLDGVFTKYQEQLVAMDIRQMIDKNQLEDFSRFVNANPELSVREAIDLFRTLENTPY